MLALLERCPKGFVAHDDRVDYTVSVKLVLILLENANLLGTYNGALLGVDLAGEHLHKGGLSGAVWASGGHIGDPL